MEKNLLQNRIRIMPLEPCDIDDVLVIARQWVRAAGQPIESELVSIEQRLRETIYGRSGCTYLVARDGENVIGVVGLREPEEKMQPYRTRGQSAELVNFFVHKDFRGLGVGYRLIQETFRYAARQGYQEVIWNSGPRYKESAWGFYDRITPDRVNDKNNYYGDGAHAPVWRVQLDTV